jgi:hypothetical protein
MRALLLLGLLISASLCAARESYLLIKPDAEFYFSSQNAEEIQ